jgi:TolA-binding protein
MKKLLLCFLISIACLGGLQTAQGQQPPQEPGRSGSQGRGAQVPDGSGQPSYDELVALVRAQTAAIKELSRQLDQLEKRVASLEQGETH